MTPTALQQSDAFTAALTRIGAQAGKTTIGDHAAHYLDRGPVRYFARPDPQIDPADLRERAVTLVNAQTDAGMAESGFVQIMTAVTVAVLPTSQPNPLPKWRNALSKAKRFHLSTTHRPLSASDDWIFDADLAQQRTKGFRALPHSIARAWPAKHTVLSTAWQDKTPIAGMVTLLHGQAATYQIGWSGVEGRAANAHHLLLMQLSTKLRAIGIKSIELGQIDTHNAPNLARFKIGSGAQIMTLGGTWLAVGRWGRWR